MNTNVNHEISLLLKEKGYDKICQAYFKNESLFNSIVIEQDSDNWNGDSYTNDVVSSPTISEVVIWLYEKHNLHIEILLSDDAPYNTFYYRILRIGQYFTLSHNGIYKNTPTLAYQEAILYILKNLKL